MCSSDLHEFAKTQGFDQVNADGMIMTNWCSEMMVKAFGIHYLERGELRNKYIRPVHLGVELRVRGRVKEATAQPGGGVLYVVDVWCEDQKGNKLVDGDARVEVR